MLTQEQRMGVLNLIPKKDKDLRHLSNWRPISLLATDYKILTKVLAIRLQKVIPSIINSDQVGYIKDRYIGENIRIIFDILTYAKSEDIDAFIAQIDFEKAFDSIEWPFLFKTLKSFNFGENFIQWIKILYTDICACVGNNGHYSETFKLSRSIRQGCPISALLFLLVAEILAIDIRNDEDIIGIKINATEFKINLMADDTTLFLSNILSLSHAIDKFEKFEKISGLKLNLGKTELIPIGKLTNKNIVLPQHLCKIKIKHGPFKALGVWFSGKETEITELNLDNRLKNMNTIINMWKPRNLSLKGKITIIRTLILPQIQFLFSMIYIPEIYLSQIDKLLFSYLWNNKPAKIRKSTIIAPIENGGLAMVDVFAVHTAAKCIWLKRLISESNSKWKVTMWKMLNFEKHILNKIPDNSISEKTLTKFHKQVILSWIESNNYEPSSKGDILEQYIFYNKYIKIGQKMIFANFGNSRHKNLQIPDIWVQNTFVHLQNLNWNITKLEYDSLKSAIPKYWKTILKSDSDTHLKITRNEPYVYIKNTKKLLTVVTSKDIYSSLVNNKCTQPRAIDTWANIFPFLENIDWQTLYTLPYKITKEPYLQSFQYKILNRVTNCRDKLFTWKITDSNMCKHCEEKIDTIEHHFYECTDSKLFWNRIEDWIKNNLELTFHFTICEILFGIPFETNQSDLGMINFIILLGKWYMNKSRSEENRFYLITFLEILKDKVQTMININNIQVSPSNEWQYRLHEIL